MTNSENKTYKKLRSIKPIKPIKPIKTVKKVLRKKIVIPEKSVRVRAEKPQIRYMKLQELCRPLKYGEQSRVPELRLRGNWLRKAGFETKQYVSVTVMEGLLVVRMIE